MEEQQTTKHAPEHAGPPPPPPPPPLSPQQQEPPPPQQQQEPPPPQQQQEPPPPSQPPEAARSSRPRFPRLRRSAKLIVLLVALAAAAFLIWKLFFAKPGVPENIVILSGRIEGDDSAVAPKTTGRVIEIRFREGDFVKAGETIAILREEQLLAREEQARAALREAEAKAASAREQITVLEEQLRQNQLQMEQARIDAEGRVRNAEADLAAAQSDLAEKQASLQFALFDRERYGRLARTGAVSERRGKETASTADEKAAAVTAAERRVMAARGALTTAQANLVNPPIRGAETAAVRRQIIRQRSEIAAANASAEQARHQLREAEENRRDLIVKAPFDGTITTRSAEPGEVLTSGTPVVTMLDLTKVYLRGFIPEGQIGKVKVGQPARVYLDSAPDKPIEAYVSRVDPEATFTPENTYFRDERVKQVVGVKLQLKAGFGFAKPGMPADGEILVQGDRWPAGKWKR
jgi:HlyD family secretion protein